MNTELEIIEVLRSIKESFESRMDLLLEKIDSILPPNPHEL